MNLLNVVTGETLTDQRDQIQRITVMSHQSLAEKFLDFMDLAKKSIYQ
jgi:hypothetical protein